VKTIVEPTDSTPSSSETNSSICSPPPARSGIRGGQRERHVNLAFVDLDVVDQAELDEVETSSGSITFVSASVPLRE